MYYHGIRLCNLFFLLWSVFDDTPVPSFLMGSNHASTVGSLKNDKNVVPDHPSLFWTYDFFSSLTLLSPFRKVQASNELSFRNDVRGAVHRRFKFMTARPA
jgi:hypothetical protein